MFSPHRRALSRRARTRLGLLGILSIIGLLATTRSPDSTPAWLQSVRQAFAQSDTATPTVVPPNPTAGLSEPPLTLQSSASVARVVAGEQLSFTTTIAAASVEPRVVDLRASIDGQLELLSVSGGSCSGGSALSCKLSVQRGQPATIVAAVRVRSNVAAGSQLIYQALAQDDLSNTAASDQVVVTITAPPTIPTTLPTPSEPAPRPTPDQGNPANSGSAPARPTIPASRPARPAPTAVPAGAMNPVAPSTPAPSTLALPGVPAAILRSSAGQATAATPVEGAAPADSWLVWVPGVPTPAQALDPGAPALAASDQEVTADALASAPVAVEQRPIMQLPNTAAAPPIAGLVAVLLGLALTIHGLRRVRRAATQLDRQGAALGRLAILASAQARRRARIDDR